MAEPSAEESLSLPASLEDFALVEQVVYPNGGQSSFYEYASVALIVDDGICSTPEGQQAFDYSLITSKQNEYAAATIIDNLLNGKQEEDELKDPQDLNRRPSGYGPVFSSSCSGLLSYSIV